MAIRNSIPNGGTHAWLRCFEQRHRICIGKTNHPADQIPIELIQKLNFSNETRAFWTAENAENISSLVWGDFGLFGPSGPLPESVTEQLLHARHGHIFTSFINLITQRIAHLYYRAWSMQRPECEVKDIRRSDQFTTLLANLCGDAHSMAPHFQWIKPSTSVLPLHIEKEFNVRADVQPTLIKWRQSSAKANLGFCKLGMHSLGRFVPYYARAFSFTYLVLRPIDLKTYLCLSDRSSKLYARLKDLIVEYLPIDARCEFALIPPMNLPIAQLGNARISQAQLSRCAT